MSDRELRELERAYALGDEVAGARLWTLRLQRGGTTLAEVRARAHAGDSAAASALGFGALFARLEAWLEVHRPEFVERLLPGLSEEEVQELERQAEGALPASVMALYRWRSGQEVGSGVGAFYSWHNLIPAAEAVTHLRERTASGGGSAVLPFLTSHGQRGIQNWVCVDVDGEISAQPGAILSLSTISGQSVALERPRLLAPSLDQWLRIYVESLEADLWKSAWSEKERAEEAHLGDTLEPKGAYGSWAREHNPTYPRPVNLFASLRDTLLLTALGTAFAVFSVYLGLVISSVGGWRAVCMAPLCFLLFPLYGLIPWAFLYALARTAHALRREDDEGGGGGSGGIPS